jgi:NAD(P)H-quinone oxidoreductase subunit 5
MILDNDPKNPATATPKTTPSHYATVITTLLWILFLSNFAFLIYCFFNPMSWTLGSLLHINGFILLLWTVVTFFGALICSYASNYLLGFAYYNRFMVLCLAFTLSVMLLVMANHVGLLLTGWLLMGVFMSQLIGVNASWSDAREAARFTQRYFLAGTLFLSAGLLLLAFYSGVFTVTGLTTAVTTMPSYIAITAALCIITAAIIQSAIFPFHKWLLSAMTAPTPASALMHAGFVNGSGILLALFASVIVTSQTLDVLLIVGGLTAILAQFTKLLQVNVKQKLACSTIAQMGFMIMQCGLGFFNAAVAHLILHGFYKAYLFLASGEEVAHIAPQRPEAIKINPLQAVVVGVYGVLGALLFTALTGKGNTMDSSIFLTLIVAITVGQVTYNILKQQVLTTLQKVIAPPVLFIVGIGVYALLYNIVTVLMQELPVVDAGTPLSGIQIAFGIVFLVGFFIMKLGDYRNIPWLYVKLMNLTQPYKKTTLLVKTSSK